MSSASNLFGIGTGLSGMAFNVNGPSIVPTMQVVSGAPVFSSGQMIGANLDGFRRFVNLARIADFISGVSLTDSDRFVPAESPPVSRVVEIGPGGTLDRNYTVMSRWGEGRITYAFGGLAFSCNNVNECLGDAVEAELNAPRQSSIQDDLEIRYHFGSLLGYTSAAKQFAVVQFSAVDAVFSRKEDRFMASRANGISTIVVLSGAGMLLSLVKNDPWKGLQGSIDEGGIVTPRTALEFALILLGDDTISSPTPLADEGRIDLSVYSGSGDRKTTRVNLEREISGKLILPRNFSELFPPRETKGVRVELSAIEGRRSYSHWRSALDDYCPRYGAAYLPNGMGLPAAYGGQLTGPMVKVWETVTFNPRGSQPFSSGVADLVAAALTMQPETFPIG